MVKDQERRRLQGIATDVRVDIVQMIAAGGSGHPGGSLSAADILTVLYFHVMRLDPDRPKWEDRDRFILSKGHAAPALYGVLAERGYFPKAWLPTFSTDGSNLQKHPDMKVCPGVEASTGALGVGISMAIGVALDARVRKKDYRVYAMLGDGECDEGEVWEAAMCAAHFKVDNLTAFLDLNGLQVDGTTEQIMSLAPVTDKWRAFGWHVVEIDGHDIGAIAGAVEEAKQTKGKPTIVVARTVKGKGVSFVENQVQWHAGSFTPEQAEQAAAELRSHSAQSQPAGD
jgi:transketolase